jgi:hypothetical protein
MKLEVGQFARLKSGYICKIININDYREPNMKYGVEANYLKDVMFIGDDDVVKASYNIIDLLEVGDVVVTNNLCGQITKIDKEHDRIWTTCYDGEYCSSDDIEEVLTREQFKASSYRIGG